LVLDAGRTVLNTALKRRVPADATSTAGIVREGPLRFSAELAAGFSRFVGWTGADLAPTFPYALLTHLHFSLRDKGFKAENRARAPASSPEFGRLPLHVSPRFFPASQNS
jgi:hypothetical protein